jgi:hypothetical protein
MVLFAPSASQGIMVNTIKFTHRAGMHVPPFTPSISTRYSSLWPNETDELDRASQSWHDYDENSFANVAAITERIPNKLIGSPSRGPSLYTRMIPMREMMIPATSRIMLI